VWQPAHQMGETEGFRTGAWWLFIEHYSLPHALFTSTELSVKQRETGGLFQITHTHVENNTYLFLDCTSTEFVSKRCCCFLSTSECGLIDCITNHFVPYLHQHRPIMIWGYRRYKWGNRTAIHELQQSNYRCMYK